MDYLGVMKDNEVPLRPEDEKFILHRLRMIPKRLHDDIVFEYIRVYHEELNKTHPQNVARWGIARYYANRFLKLYKVNWNE